MRYKRAVQRLTADLDREPAPVHREPANGYDATERFEHRPIQQAHLVVGTRGPGLAVPGTTLATSTWHNDREPGRASYVPGTQ